MRGLDASCCGVGLLPVVMQLWPGCVGRCEASLPTLEAFMTCPSDHSGPFPKTVPLCLQLMGIHGLILQTSLDIRFLVPVVVKQSNSWHVCVCVCQCVCIRLWESVHQQLSIKSALSFPRNYGGFNLMIISRVCVSLCYLLLSHLRQ